MYCFDTDVLSSVIKQPSLNLIRRLARVPVDQQFTTAINLGELLYGAFRSRNTTLEARVRDLFLEGIAVLPLDEESAEVYAKLRSKLESEGRRLADPDLQIAAVALSRGLTLVTGNVRHFSRIPELKIDNWLQD